MILGKFHRTIRRSVFLAALSAPILGLLGASALPTASARPGEQIFRQQCAACHGAKGQGTKAYNKPLAGSKSVGELASFIAKSMPPGAPRKLPKADAQRVAGYIYSAFYSPLARARNRPARVELSHLTVRQYRNTLTDLIGSFRPAIKLDDRHGLSGEYFKTGHFDSGDRVLQRLDPEIHFDYGTGDPDKTQPDPYQFAMRWEGSVIPADTGEYEFIVRTEQAAQLWINDMERPLIDALVKSGNDNEYRATIYLVGGRPYPLRLDFSKGVQGVDNLAEVRKKPPARASLSLEWRPPKRPAEVIPQRCLCPVVVPTAYVASTPFPPDDRSAGFERADSVSKEWEQATTDGAIDAARYVTAHLKELSGAGEDVQDRPAKLLAWCRTFVERAFRRSLTPAIERLYVDQPFKGAPDPETGLKRVVLLALASPRFLYRGLNAASPDAYDVASRLSFALWDSLPDQELLKAAASGQLSTREQVEQQASRMAQDPRAWYKLRDFLLQWLRVDNYPDLSKDPKKYPGFDQSIAADLRTSLELFLQQVAWSERSDFRELLLSDRLMMDGRLAKIYGCGLPQDAPFEPVELDPCERAGVLTHPYLLSSFAYVDGSSPIHRGVLIARSLLGRALMPPPQAFTPLPSSLHPHMTTRQRVALQTKPAACLGCHGMINPLGFTLEKFDAIGRLRTEDNGQPVDASGSYKTRDGQVVRFHGVRDLARYLATSDDAHTAFVEKLFQYMMKQPVQAYGPAALPELEKSFAANQFSIRKQMVATATLCALK